MLNIKDRIVRWLAKSYLFKYVDGYKTDIMRIVLALNMLMVVLILACHPISVLLSYVTIHNDVCYYADMLNGYWIALGVFLSNLGLEFGIQDGRAKKKEVLGDGLDKALKG